MRLPPSVRYFPSRLQVLLNPWLLLGILVTGVVGVYAWEYRQNPGQLPWQIGSTGLGSSGDSTSSDVLLESLTPEEQAVAAELDNIELLLAQLDSDVSALTSGGELSAAASLNQALGNASGVPSETGVERLTRYIDEYSFLGTRARGSNIQSDQQEGVLPVQRPSESVLTSQPDTNQPTTVLAPSALADALARQEAEQDAATTSAQTPDVDSRGLPVLPASDAAAATEQDNADTSTFSFGQVDTGVVPGSLNGLDRSFIRTTPNMSPPPGTTGYTPPASLSTFNGARQGANSANPFPAAQPATGAFGNQPSINVPDRSQVLPSTDTSVAAPLEVPTFDGTSQDTSNQPRNAWEAFWD